MRYPAKTSVKIVVEGPALWTDQHRAVEHHPGGFIAARLSVLCCGFLLVSACISGEQALGQAPPENVLRPSQPAREVARHVARFDSGTLEQRDQAERALLEMGPAVLSDLDALALGASGESLQRLHRIQQQLRVDRDAQWLSESTLTLHQQLSAEQLAAEIARQTANQVEGLDLAIPMAGDAEQQPFWEFVQQLLDQQRLRLAETQDKAHVLQLVADDAAEPAQRWLRRKGPFLIAASLPAIAEANQADYPRTIHLTVDFFWEPRLAPVWVALPFDGIVVAGSDDRPLTTHRGEAVLRVPVRPGQVHVRLQVPVELERPEDNVHRFAGEFEVVVAGPADSIRMPLRSPHQQASELTIGQLSVSLERIDYAGNQAAVIVGKRLDNHEADRVFASHMGWASRIGAMFIDENKQEHAARSIEVAGLGSERATMLGRFDVGRNQLNGELRLLTPTSVTRLEVPFDFVDRTRR